MAGPVIRISLGFFDAEKREQVETWLAESRERLESGIRALNGQRGYFVGVDRINNAMHNVSFWDSVEDAAQMATFQPMLDLAHEFLALGARFQRPILNFDTLWNLPAESAAGRAPE